jgi:hypothetical protein
MSAIELNLGANEGCAPPAPEGGFSTGWESCGGTKAGRGTPRRDGPDLTGCEAVRLTTRGIAELNSGELWPLNARILLLAPHALTKGCLRMTERTTQLEAALSAQSALIEEAQAEIINYLSGQIGSPEFIDRIIRLLDGPRQRDVQRQAREALGDEEPGNIA